MSDELDWNFVDKDDAKAEIRAAVEYLLRGATGGGRGDRRSLRSCAASPMHCQQSRRTHWTMTCPAVGSPANAPQRGLIVWQPSSLENARSGAHIASMPQYVDEAFVVLVHILLDSGETQRERYVIGCSTREEAEARIRYLYPSEPNIKLFASPLSATETEELKLMAGEFRPWQ